MDSVSRSSAGTVASVVMRVVVDLWFLLWRVYGRIVVPFGPRGERPLYVPKEWL